MYCLLVCSAFSGRSRPPMMPVFSVMSSFLYGHIPRRCSSSSLSSYHSVSHEFLSLSFCLLRLYAEGIHFSTRALTNFSVFVRCCSSSFYFHPPCPKPLNWIGVQSNWFSLTFSRSTFRTIPVVECPPSSTSMFLRHTVPYSKSESLLLFSLTLTSFFLSVILLVYWMLFSNGYSTFHFLMTFTVFCDYTS